MKERKKEIERKEEKEKNWPDDKMLQCMIEVNLKLWGNDFFPLFPVQQEERKMNLREMRKKKWISYKREDEKPLEKKMKKKIEMNVMSRKKWWSNYFFPSSSHVIPFFPISFPSSSHFIPFFFPYLVLDSSGKFPPPGVLEGTLTDLGRFDECLNVNQLLEGDEFPVSTRIRGQYCSLILRPPLPPRPRFHTLCNKVPSLSNLSTNDSVSL